MMTEAGQKQKKIIGKAKGISSEIGFFIFCLLQGLDCQKNFKKMGTPSPAAFYFLIYRFL
jgi:hypothetical protein